MGTIPALTQFVDATTAVASEVNSNFASVRDTFNSYAVLTDTAKTISVTHTYSASQTWQRNACNRLVEQAERERCMSNTNMPYDDYRRQVGAKRD